MLKAVLVVLAAVVWRVLMCVTYFYTSLKPIYNAYSTGVLLYHAGAGRVFFQRLMRCLSGDM